MRLFPIKIKKEKPEFDVLIAYRQAVGVVDLRALDKFIKNNEVKRIIFVTEEPFTEGTKNFLRDLEWSIPVEVVVDKRLLRKVGVLKREFSDRRVKVINLDEFGERPYQYDSC